MAVDEARLKKLEAAVALLGGAYEMMNDEPVTAAAARGTVGGQAARMAAIAGPAQRSPDQTSTGRRFMGGGLPSPVIVTAAVGARSVTAGSVLTRPSEIGEITSEALNALEPDGSTGRRRRTVVLARWHYPEERQLGNDADENTRRIDAVCGISAGRYDRHSGGLAATGGVCLPANVDFSVPTWTTADRPLRDGLPGFEVTRGGVQFVTPPDIGLSSLQTGGPTGAGQATGIWTEATDASPGGATKPVWQVACGATQQVYVNAVPTRVEFGNMEARFAPEQLAANTEQAIATAARDCETELLTQIAAASKQILPKQYLGATRDLLANADLLIAQYRNSHRYDPGAALTAIFPEWAKDLVRSDMARELAHDNAGPIDVMAVTDAQIDNYFAVRGVNVIWTLDGLPAGTYGTGGHAITQQYFSIATAGAEPQWPGQVSDAAFMVVWFLFVEGTFQFLDGGRLDLGVVRDSLLDSTNDYETFCETFEGIAFRGNECYQVQQMVLNTGGSAGSVAASGYVA